MMLPARLAANEANERRPERRPGFAFFAGGPEKNPQKAFTAAAGACIQRTCKPSTA